MQQFIHTIFPQFHELELMEGLVQQGKRVLLSKDAIFAASGSEARSIPLIMSGSLGMIHSDGDGDRLFVGTIRKGQSCGVLLNSVFAPRLKMPIDVVAVENTELLAIPIVFAQQWLTKFTSWNDFVFTSIANDYATLLDKLHAHTYDTIEQRLLKALSERANTNETHTLNISHEQLAFELNTSRVVVSRALKNLERDTKIQLFRNRIKII